jgi:hypothetical protein
MICLNSDILKLMLEKLRTHDLFDLFILNKIILTKNFYLMIKRLGHHAMETSIVLEKCVNTVVTNRKESLILDSVTYILLLVIQNL